MRVFKRHNIYGHYPYLNKRLYTTVKESDKFNGCSEQYSFWALFPACGFSIVSTYERDFW